MNTLQEFFNEYLHLFERGGNLAIIDRFYADDIIQFENSEEAIKGKANCIEKEKEALEMVKNVKQKISSFVIDQQEGLVMGEMCLRFDSQKKGRKKLEEAFVQKWRNGKIIYQRFYYSGFQDDHE